MSTNLHHLIEERAETHSQSPALTFKNQTLTYHELWEQVRSAAHGLQKIGVSGGQRVAVFLDKRIETVVAIYGATAAGGVVVPLNPLLRPNQVGHVLRDCGVRVLVTSAERLTLMRDELASCPSVRAVVVVGTSTDPGVEAGSPQVHPWVRLLESECHTPLPDIPDSDVAVIIYTSGSTGKPKGVMLSHANAIATSQQPYLGNTADDVILVALPLSFDAGFCQLTLTFAVGAHAILMNYLLPGDVPRLCARHRVTGITCVAPLWIQIAEAKWPDDAKASLRYFATTGGRMPKTILEKLREVFPAATPFLMYGMTEAFRSTYLDPSEVDRRPDSIGKAVPTAEILIVRPDGSPCDPGEEGELVHRGGPHIALGYWNDPERTAERFRPVPGRAEDGGTIEPAVWSGDRAVTDDDGFIYFIGRRDEMIKTSGYRISPTEVEEVAYATALVRDAVAFGVEDEALGQRIRLVVAPAVTDFDTDALLAAMRSRLPQFMVPSSVVVLETLPRSPNGKFDRTLIREEFGT
ncbi:acyl-CoA ligase (AMP-forming), exosortase A system-associated [Mycobacterium sp. NAZ190054]|uniref:acyl-CoA ligase (AMP-forming), exosortase A system-associated n=1 Tax=Mycobacterium sp. NAZ190054 TaxID=1747766 RepID=UPI0007912536|nr:acyl-CoA ligase (AMP-forming), exosortase A system-associated [Mycobacterium sp. NAZ190054]KWX56726.1 acyl--CoA ligase [Mycobacterium sp. NAZ190054]